MTGRARERVMGVVPALAHRQDSENEVVTTHILAWKRTASPQMTGRIDAPRHVVHEKNPDEAAPQKAGQRTHPGKGDEPTQHGRQKERQHHPQREKGVDGTQGFAIA